MSRQKPTFELGERSKPYVEVAVSLKPSEKVETEVSPLGYFIFGLFTGIISTVLILYVF